MEAISDSNARIVRSYTNSNLPISPTHSVHDLYHHPIGNCQFTGISIKQSCRFTPVQKSDASIFTQSDPHRTVPKFIGDDAIFTHISAGEPEASRVRYNKAPLHPFNAQTLNFALENKQCTAQTKQDKHRRKSIPSPYQSKISKYPRYFFSQHNGIVVECNKLDLQLFEHLQSPSQSTPSSTAAEQKRKRLTAGKEERVFIMKYWAARFVRYTTLDNSPSFYSDQWKDINLWRSTVCGVNASSFDGRRDPLCNWGLFGKYRNPLTPVLRYAALLLRRSVSKGVVDAIATISEFISSYIFAVTLSFYLTVNHRFIEQRHTPITPYQHSLPPYLFVLLPRADLNDGFTEHELVSEYLVDILAARDWATKLRFCVFFKSVVVKLVSDNPDAFAPFDLCDKESINGRSVYTNTEHQVKYDKNIHGLLLNHRCREHAVAVSSNSSNASSEFSLDMEDAIEEIIKLGKGDSYGKKADLGLNMNYISYPMCGNTSFDTLCIKTVKISSGTIAQSHRQQLNDKGVLHIKNDRNYDFTASRSIKIYSHHLLRPGVPIYELTREEETMYSSDTLHPSFLEMTEVDVKSHGYSAAHFEAVCARQDRLVLAISFFLAKAVLTRIRTARESCHTKELAMVQNFLRSVRDDVCSVKKPKRRVRSKSCKDEGEGGEEEEDDDEKDRDYEEVEAVVKEAQPIPVDQAFYDAANKKTKYKKPRISNIIAINKRPPFYHPGVPLPRALDRLSLPYSQYMVTSHLLTVEDDAFAGNLYDPQFLSVPVLYSLVCFGTIFSEPLHIFIFNRYDFIVAHLAQILPMAMELRIVGFMDDVLTQPDAPLQNETMEATPVNIQNVYFILSIALDKEEDIYANLLHIFYPFTWAFIDNKQPLTDSIRDSLHSLLSGLSNTYNTIDDQMNSMLLIQHPRNQRKLKQEARDSNPIFPMVLNQIMNIAPSLLLEYYRGCFSVDAAERKRSFSALVGKHNLVNDIVLCVQSCPDLHAMVGNAPRSFYCEVYTMVFEEDDMHIIVANNSNSLLTQMVAIYVSFCFYINISSHVRLILFDEMKKLNLGCIPDQDTIAAPLDSFRGPSYHLLSDTDAVLDDEAATLKLALVSVYRMACSSKMEKALEASSRQQKRSTEADTMISIFKVIHDQFAQQEGWSRAEPWSDRVHDTLRGLPTSFYKLTDVLDTLSRTLTRHEAPSNELFQRIADIAAKESTDASHLVDVYLMDRKLMRFLIDKCSDWNVNWYKIADEGEGEFVAWCNKWCMKKTAPEYRNITASSISHVTIQSKYVDVLSSHTRTAAPPEMLLEDVSSSSSSSQSSSSSSTPPTLPTPSSSIISIMRIWKSVICSDAFKTSIRPMSSDDTPHPLEGGKEETKSKRRVKKRRTVSKKAEAEAEAVDEDKQMQM